MTPFEARQIVNAASEAYNARLDAWNAWTDVNDEAQCVAYKKAISNWQAAIDALHEADLNNHHLFAIFAGEFIAIK